MSTGGRIIGGEAQRPGAAPKVTCAWCGAVVRSAGARPSLRTCQTCFARMMSEHIRAHQRQAGGSSR